MRFQIDIDDNDRDAVIDHPWTASIFQIDPESGKSGDVLGSGFGSTPSQAVAHALEDASNSTDDDVTPFLTAEEVRP